MLTLADICTALWDSTLGHISCNDENDDGDEDSEIGVCTVCVLVDWLLGVCIYFLPFFFFHYQSAQLEKMGDDHFSKVV